ncbi:MazG nucleotide pyrophosphohydrolase domain-containing protein [Corynebacterium kozikiae]|uniref:MazG nucleotide pyrophosphohydrolase domain-containing protein n=1 Tax=Corynebacterium kozikiae TaxID=2968469 RepID=UPI00211C9381|nr:MazG nucleotide pyrophosphohydrolase domain-containing protein [Corynebacterium sp. 76QC2CO]MCQ9343966.1 nucleotide pyrophosphohydrolase [Corynebacterium sp. 76QC2CO]
MTVLLLDSRWPSMVPFDLLGSLQGTCTFTDEVPVGVRWNLPDHIAAGPDTILVSTNAWDPQVHQAITRGDEVLEVPSRTDATGTAVALMRQALRRGEWEQSQTHASLVPYLLEESQEFVEAVRDDLGDEAIRDELGDLLLQVLFHAEIADRRGAFDFSGVAQAFVDKMAARQPYLFDGSTGIVSIEEQEELWQKGKNA